MRYLTGSLVALILTLSAILGGEQPRYEVTSGPSPERPLEAPQSAPPPIPVPESTLPPETALRASEEPIPAPPPPSSQNPPTPPNTQPIPIANLCEHEDLIRSWWEDPSDQDRAVQIAWRESRCNPEARNPSGASGLFQIMLPLHADLFWAIGCNPEQWSDPICNLKVARALWEGSGWRPWGY